MAVERLLARRYLLGRKRFTFINIISLLATLGITFGVAALIVVMSVFNGFNGLVTGILQDVDPHLVAERIPRSEARPAAAVEKAARALPGVRGFAPFVKRKAMAIAKGYNEFAWVKGVDPAAIDGVSGLRTKVVQGRFDFGVRNGVILGVVLADRMRVLVGDTLLLVSPAGMEQMLTQIVEPTMFRCPVVGIFDSRNKDVDRAYIFMALPAARAFFRMEGENTGYEMRFDDIARSDEAKAVLREAAGDGWNVLTWYDLHKDLYSVMKIERWSAFILLALIIAVAVFNILASLTMLVLEKKRDIGILRTLGMPAARIRRVFLLQGVAIGAVGTAVGMALGLAVAWAQQTFGIFKLNAAFIIPALPVDVHASDIVIIAASTFLLCVLAAWYPALRAKRVEIIDAIRWE